MIAEGRVKNISNASIKGIQVVVSHLDKDGKFITSDSHFIEYNPILAGQISPFKVMTRYNPAMKKATLDFKKFGGGSIGWTRKK